MSSVPADAPQMLGVSLQSTSVLPEMHADPLSHHPHPAVATQVSSSVIARQTGQHVPCETRLPVQTVLAGTHTPSHH